jgi:hypothetical protein
MEISNSQFGRKLDKNWQKNEGRKKGGFFLPSFFCQFFDFAVHIENCCMEIEFTATLSPNCLRR